ncbi:MAG: hypothetical protein J7604_07090 [Sporocytophaga sp.]|uniref:hypothetical protein n=1 Tax=Sporocytophaga sp. TaxID=2231183 RepID=UPI001B2CBDD9|nr:hypothetical protein [Sporocytophaga sp.]MBO9699958.1 hypothetical protein [Sporocytophaga sp.]
MSREQFEDALIHAFNFNPKRGLKTILNKKKSLYSGDLEGDKFKITSNDVFRLSNDATYFFFTRVTGKIIDNKGSVKVIVNVDLSKNILFVIVPSLIIYIVISIIGNIYIGLTSLLGTVAMYLYGKVQLLKTV